MRIGRYILLGLVSVSCCMPAFAQQKKQNREENDELIQFSGVVVSSDSLQPVSFASIMIRESHRGTISDYYGYFSFVAEPLDTIEFRSIGYRDAAFVIPDTLRTTRYSIIQLMNRDTVELPEATVYPWPTKEQFKQAFLNTHIPDDDMDRAQRNLDPAKMEAIMNNMPMGGSENYKYQMQQYQTRLYYAGQAPSISILNPLAWAKFIKAWKNGKFQPDQQDPFPDY